MNGPALTDLVHGNVPGNGNSSSVLDLEDVSGEGGLRLLCRKRGKGHQLDEAVIVAEAGTKQKEAPEARRRSWGGNESKF